MPMLNQRGALCPLPGEETAHRGRMKQCEEIRFTPKSEVNDYLRAIGYEPLKEGISVRDLLKRPNITLAALQPYTGMQVEEKAARQIEIEIKYEGYITRQQKQVENFKKDRVKEDTGEY